MQILLTIGANLIALLGVAAAVLMAWIFTEAVIYLWLLRPDLERDLGFCEGDTSLPYSNFQSYISAVAVSSVTFGGAFEEAGFRAGDVLPDESHISLFKTLHRHRGRSVELTVVDGGPGPRFRERTRRVIRIVVPPRRS